ncbi:endonuclease/exonuclease/phosphatase family protein [Bacillus cereus]|uniref:endonuclease/exonuclease/phosphatase family protein n=1 Tax=Bacillus cereus TaxID=1396 RepID=UPI000BFCC762|nr:endonuclease/exonuclease/phosphatase family protein [Bacillus cereus]PGZ15467.1 hypothetical protein COE46_14890 [Bacillus cereus]
MRIATFNIWNKQTLWKERLRAICEEVRTINADILALQEVRTQIDAEKNINLAQFIANQTNYPYCIFENYPDSPDEGLAFLSKIPISKKSVIWDANIEETNYCAIRITFQYKRFEFGVTNVHLNWRSYEIREQQMKAVHDWILEENINRQYEILCGDFNDNPESSIHHFLTHHDWLDIAQFKEKQCNMKVQPTLDFKNNPYLHNSEIPSRYDWILLKTYKLLNLQIRNVKIFGNKPTTRAQIVPSDHYGVFVEFNLPCINKQ